MEILARKGFFALSRPAQKSLKINWSHYKQKYPSKNKKSIENPLILEVYRKDSRIQLQLHIYLLIRNKISVNILRVPNKNTKNVKKHKEKSPIKNKLNLIIS